MLKTLKIFLSVFAAIILLIVIAAVALPLLFSPNDFKPQIASAVKDKTGRDLTISGDIELSIFPWIGVTAEKLALSNAEGFQKIPFAEIENAQIRAKLLPLLSKKFEVDRVVLKGLILNLEKNETGISNWDDFKQAQPEAHTAATSTEWEDTNTVDTDTDVEALKTVASLAIAGINLENARLNWHDRQNDTRFSIKELNLISDDLAFDKPIDLKLSFILEQPEQELTGFYQLSAELLLNENFDRFNATRFDLSAEIRGKDIPGGSMSAKVMAQADLNLTAQLLELTKLDVESGDLHVLASLSGKQVIDAPVFEGPVSIARFNPSAWLKQAGIDPPVMRDAQALTSLSADFKLQVASESADLQSISIQLDDSAIKGNGRVDNFGDPAISFNLNVDTLNVDRYLAPEDESDKTAQPIAGPAAAVAAGASMIQVETLRGLNINGLLSIGRLTISNLLLHGVDLKLTAKDGKVNTEQAVKTLYRGSYEGTMNLDVTGELPQWRLNEKFIGIQIEPLLNDYAGSAKIAGAMTASTRLQASGNDSKALKSTLNGQVDFLFKDSIIRGFNLQQMIDDAKSLLKGTQVLRDNPKDQTAFSEIKGSARVVNGVISNNDLIATASKIEATGKGTADLKSERIDYRINAKLVRSKVAESTADKIKELPIVINITGNFKEPEYKLDIASMLKDQQLEKLERKKDKLLDKLDKKVGPGVSDILKKFF
ncbi:AsmA family protein [Methylotuvimicrobium buryatense]|uniref:AsmA family protein n=1 Tax=Methylotuvimicrobium buryatense TaxID=95641 RepID=UPI00034B560E|nr:AsmA family protein [Methylotuvimicrobium buryatense]